MAGTNTRNDNTATSRFFEAWDGNKWRAENKEILGFGAYEALRPDIKCSKQYIWGGEMARWMPGNLRSVLLSVALTEAAQVIPNRADRETDEMYLARARLKAPGKVGVVPTFGELQASLMVIKDPNNKTSKGVSVFILSKLIDALKLWRAPRRVGTPLPTEAVHMVRYCLTLAKLIGTDEHTAAMRNAPAVTGGDSGLLDAIGAAEGAATQQAAATAAAAPAVVPTLPVEDATEATGTTG